MRSATKRQSRRRRRLRRQQITLLADVLLIIRVGWLISFFLWPGRSMLTLPFVRSGEQNN